MTSTPGRHRRPRPRTTRLLGRVPALVTVAAVGLATVALTADSGSAPATTAGSAPSTPVARATPPDPRTIADEIRARTGERADRSTRRESLVPTGERDALASGSGSVEVDEPAPQPCAIPMDTGGVTAHTAEVYRVVCGRFPDITAFGGFRYGGTGYHPQGRAIDAMISGEEGWAVATWAREHAYDLGIIEVIHAQRIWTTARAEEGWRWMADRGSVSANHYDHVHLSIGP